MYNHEDYGGKRSGGEGGNKPRHISEIVEDVIEKTKRAAEERRQDSQQKEQAASQSEPRQ